MVSSKQKGRRVGGSKAGAHTPRQANAERPAKRATAAKAVHAQGTPQLCRAPDMDKWASCTARCGTAAQAAARKQSKSGLKRIEVRWVSVLRSARPPASFPLSLLTPNLSFLSWHKEEKEEASEILPATIQVVTKKRSKSKKQALTPPHTPTPHTISGRKDAHTKRKRKRKCKPTHSKSNLFSILFFCVSSSSLPYPFMSLFWRSS